MTGPQENELLTYRSFWEENLQKVEEISAQVEKKILAIEKRQLRERESYQELERSLNLLLSIYSSYNSLKGREYLLKLKSCLNEHLKLAENESARFGVLHFLLSKVREQTSSGFEEFPRLKHEFRDELPQKTAPVHTKELPFHWITFRSGNQWFVAGYDGLTIIRREHALIKENASGEEVLMLEEKQVEIINLPASHSNPDTIECYLIITIAGTAFCYAASEIGKRISASKDVITPRLKEYSLVRKKHIRLFGKNHIFLEG